MDANFTNLNTDKIEESSLIASNIYYVPEGTGAVATNVQSKLRESVSVKDFGAVLDGIVDDTQAWRNALATGKQIWFPAGKSRITDQLVLQAGQTILGEGRTQSYFYIDSTFNMMASCVVQPGIFGLPGCLFNLGFQFVQDDQPVRANVTAYPPAISCHDIPRVVLDNVRIENAYDGIKATGNAGGCYFGLLEIGALRRGVEIDGSLDFFHGGHWHFWPFEMTNQPLLSQVYYDGIGEAVSIGTADACEISSIATFRHKIVVKANASTAIPIQLGRVHLDGDDAEVRQAGGRLDIAQFYTTKSGTATNPSLYVTGGICTVGSCYISSTNTVADLQVAGGTLIVHGGEFNSINDTSVAKVTTGTLILDGVRIHAGQRVYTAPHVVQVGGCLKVKNCSWSDKGVATGTAVAYTSDENANECSSNDFGNWAYSPPANQQYGKYTNNYFSSSTDIISNNITGTLRYKRFTGVANASGVFTVAHGIANGNTKIILAQGFYKGGNGEMINMPFDYLDGGNMRFSGGGSNVPVRATVVYTETAHAW